MLRKNYFTLLFAAALFFVGAGAVFAQTTLPVSGRVVIKKADNSEVPAAGVLVQVYRMDQKVKLPTDKTDKKGGFAFAGLPLGARYVLVVSGAGISPIIYPNVPAGADNFTITVSEGDGKVFTEDEVRQALAAGTSNSTTTTTENAEPTAEQKKAQEEQMKKVKEVETKNAKINEKNTIIQASLKDGSEAFTAKNYDLALAKFEEGYNADTAYVGSAPVFLTGKGKVLSVRAVDKYNKAVKITDAAEKMQAMEGVTKDFSDAVDSFNMSWTILKNATPTTIPDPKNYEVNKADVLAGISNVVDYMVKSERIDSAKLPVIKALMQEYMTVETDAAKKSKAQVNLADLYRIAGDSDNAIIEYKKALELSPDNPDALAGLGLSLFNSGEISNNVAQKQEGLGYMERFIQVAPDNHKLKSSVAEAVTYLKSQKITPTKVTNTKKKS